MTHPQHAVEDESSTVRMWQRRGVLAASRNARGFTMCWMTQRALLTRPQFTVEDEPSNGTHVVEDVASTGTPVSTRHPTANGASYSVSSEYRARQISPATSSDAL
jgi:hypothetical protein